jgi:HTH-type transcriptional regulator / antitoxin HigA
MANEFRPDYLSLPGDTLSEVLESIGMTQADLAQRMGRPRKTINEIIQGKTAVTPETALQLELVLGIPASFWNNRERQYQEAKARIEEEKQLADQVGWLEANQLPVQEMRQRGWVAHADDQPGQLREVLRFFGVASTQQCETVWASYGAVFRQSTKRPANWAAVYAWLRKGELEAQELTCQPYDRQAFLNVLEKTRSLTAQKFETVWPTVVEQCAGAGVAVVVVPALPNTAVSGATRWLTPEKALLQLSLRYKSDDQFWFSFFHEGGHICKHGKKKLFIDLDGANGESDALEEEANRFAADLLIPPGHWQQFKKRFGSGYYPGRDEVKQFAQELGIAPGIVVGRLQRENVMPHANLNDLRCGLHLDDDGQIVSGPFKKA